MWQFGGPADDTAVDVTGVFEAKVGACSAHGSQTPMLDRSVEEELREHLARTAREHGLPEGRLAEGYRVVHTAWSRSCSGRSSRWSTTSEDTARVSATYRARRP